ncbi:effector-associated domain 2-containing protein [Kutzneria sp. CA-103260]|uniref:effector-associated domain 2-containing protein n=1 Tax=Kutzneria sp. CA-103260 TaxID=2802641 RepID=UPI001BAC8107|nr:hypothetical protein [Kutzneria sp. CA-103260]QUQ62449.1 hypothetical protein JJ691_01610 [Kutzneria sp. CA-103260]
MENHLDAHYVSMVLVDVERFGDPTRMDNHHLSVRSGVYSALTSAFTASDIPWEDCDVADLGDGVMILVPPMVSKSRLVARLPEHLVDALDRHNRDIEPPSRARLRLALHAGEIHRDEHGITGDALNFGFRLLDAPAAKRALALAAVNLVVIVSEELYRSVVRHDPAAQPDTYRRIDFQTKETSASAWIRLPGDTHERAATLASATPMLAESAPPSTVEPEPEDPVRQVLVAQRRLPRKPQVGLTALVDALLAVPFVASESGRRLLLDNLRAEVANAVAYHPQARLHVFSLVNTCACYDYGIEELLGTVHELEGESPAVRALDATVAALLERPAPGDRSLG